MPQQWWQGQQNQQQGQQQQRPPTSGYGTYGAPQAQPQQPSGVPQQQPTQPQQPQGPMQTSSYANNPLWQQNAAGTGYEQTNFYLPDTLAKNINQFNTDPAYQKMLTPSSSWHQGDWQLQNQLKQQQMQQQAQLQRSLLGQVNDVYGGDAGAMRDAYTEQLGGSQHFSVIDEMLQALMSNPNQLGGA
jgi:hypothetical protein